MCLKFVMRISWRRGLASIPQPQLPLSAGTACCWRSTSHLSGGGCLPSTIRSSLPRPCDRIPPPSIYRLPSSSWRTPSLSAVRSWTALSRPVSSSSLNSWPLPFSCHDQGIPSYIRWACSLPHWSSSRYKVFPWQVNHLLVSVPLIWLHCRPLVIWKSWWGNRFWT